MYIHRERDRAFLSVKGAKDHAAAGRSAIASICGTLVCVSPICAYAHRTAHTCLNSSTLSTHTNTHKLATLIRARTRTHDQLAKWHPPAGAVLVKHHVFRARIPHHYILQ